MNFKTTVLLICLLALVSTIRLVAQDVATSEITDEKDEDALFSIEITGDAAADSSPYGEKPALTEAVHPQKPPQASDEEALSAKEEDEEEDDDDDLPPIFVLNLDRSPQRWQGVSQELQRAGVAASRLSAIDGRLLSEAQLAQNVTALGRQLQPRGVLGCYLSHRLFWRSVVDARLVRAIVLEDDVQLEHGAQFKARLRALLRELDQVDAVSVAQRTYSADAASRDAEMRSGRHHNMTGTNITAFVCLFVCS